MSKKCPHRVRLIVAFGLIACILPHLFDGVSTAEAQSAIEKVAEGSLNRLNHEYAERRAREQVAARRGAQEKTADQKRQIREQRETAEIRKQSQPNLKSPPLHQAVANGQVDEVKALLEKGVSANQADPVNGWKPLHYAAFYGQLDVARVLVEHKAVLNFGTGTAQIKPLQLAAFRGNDELVQFLVLNGANINGRDCFGFTSLHVAAENLDLETVSLLLANGAIAQVETSNGLTALDLVDVGVERVVAANRADHPIQLPPPIPSSNVSGATCSRCNGTGKRSAEEMRVITSAMAQQISGAGGGIVMNDGKCPKCGGSGVVYSAERLRIIGQAKAVAEERQHEIDRLYFDIDQPVIHAGDIIAKTLVAFGPDFATKNPETMAIREAIVKEYKGTSWRPQKKAAVVSVPPPSTNAKPITGESNNAKPNAVGNNAPSAVAKQSVGNTPQKQQLPISLAELVKMPFAEVKVSGEWVKLERAAKVYNPVNSKNAGQEFGVFPSELAGRSFMQVPMHNTMDEAKLSFSVVSEGVVLLAVQGWGGRGSRGDWQKECIDSEGLKKQGWEEIPNSGGRSFFYRSCKTGESMTYRTDKYHPPLLIR